MRAARLAALKLLVVSTIVSLPQLTIFSANTLRAAPAKVALVIGNGNYDGADRLQSPLNDAKLIGGTLKSLGFETHIGLDLSRDEMKAQLDWLAHEGAGARVVLFYFAGHGFESDGENFLVPVHPGAQIDSLTHRMLLEHAIKLNAVRAQIKHGAPTVMISLIDACREPSRGGAAPTLKREQAAHGELIAFSTADHGLAYDSMRTFGQPVDDSPFAYFLSMYMKAPNATIKLALEQTQQQVSDLSQGGQQPWIASGLVGDVVLGATPPPDAVTRAAPANSPARLSGPTRGPSGTAHATPDDATQKDGVLPNATPGEASAADNAAQRGNSWDDMDTRIAAAAQHPDAPSLANLHALDRQHDASATTTLGLIYENGTGAKHDARAALAYYRKAADQHFPIAQTLLGEAYVEGKLVPADLDKAESLLAQAAARNFTRAELDLYQLRAQRNQGDPSEDMNSAAHLMLDRFSRAVAGTNAPASH